jgi:hypothetical protein
LVAAIESDFASLMHVDDASSTTSVVATAADTVDSRQSSMHYATQQAALFVGRSALLRQLDQFVHSGNCSAISNALPKGSAGSSASNVLAICGQGGCGKSALLARTVLSLESQASNVLCIAHFIGAPTPHSSSGAHILVKIMHDLKAALALNMPLPDAQDADLAQQVSTFLQAAHQLLVSRRCTALVAIDALDQLSSIDDRDLRWLPFAWPSTFRVLLTVASVVTDATFHASPSGRTAEHDAEHDADSDAANIVVRSDDGVAEDVVQSRSLRALEARNIPVIALGPLNEAEKTQFATAYLARVSKKLSPAQLQVLVKNKQTGTSIEQHQVRMSVPYTKH